MSELKSKIRVGFIGLGAMGFGMAGNLLGKPRYDIMGYDVFEPSSQKFAARDGRVGKSPREVAGRSDFIICMATNAQQIEEILFHSETSALKALPKRAIILVCSTVSSEFHEILLVRIAEAGRADVQVVDCPVSGGTKRAADGTLTIFASGSVDALERSHQLLQDMSEKLYQLPGGPGTTSKVKMVNQLLVGIHIAAAAEAMALAAKMGLNTREVFDVIVNAAGNSWAFENRVPHMLDGDWTPHSALDIFVKDMGIVMSTSWSLQFPLPLSAAVEQLYVLGSAQGYGREDDAGLVRVFLPNSPNAVNEKAQMATAREKESQNGTSSHVSKVGMIGLGAMGQGMAASLLRAGYTVQGYDVAPQAVDRFLVNNSNAVGMNSPSEAVKDAEVVILMVQNAAQAHEALFGSGKAAEKLSDGAVIILSSTVPPSFVRNLEKRLDALGKHIMLVDAPVSGGVRRAADGSLTIICSGKSPAIRKAKAPLLAMAGSSTNLCLIQGGVGAASSVKLINQHLAGTHIMAAAEAMAFTARLGLDPKVVFGILKGAAAWSWMFDNRVPQMLEADWTPYSALSIFVKDMGIVVEEAKRLGSFAPIASAVHTLYLSGAAHGLAKEADAGIVRLWEILTGTSVSESVSRGQAASQYGI